MCIEGRRTWQGGPGHARERGKGVMFQGTVARVEESVWHEALGVRGQTVKGGQRSGAGL